MALKKLGIEHEVIGISEIDKFAIKSYMAIHGETKNFGDISKIDPIELPDFDFMTYSFPCFTGSSLVLTKDGYKQIKDIQVGDLVITHDNSYKRVTKVFNNGPKETLVIKGMAIDEIITTNNHKFYVRERYRDYDSKKRLYTRKFKNPKWIKAGELTKNHYFGIAINKESKLPKWDGIEFKWSDGRKRSKKSNIIKPLLEDDRFWWLVGRYVADGWIKNQGGIVLGIGHYKYQHFKDTFQDLINYHACKEKSVYKIHFSYKELGEFLKPIGRGAANKRIPGFILDLPVKQLKSFLQGYFDGDGYVIDKYQKCTSVSKELIYGIGQCVAKVYHRPYAIYKNIVPKKRIIEGRVVNQRDNYNLVFKKETSKFDKAFYEDGFIWYPFNESYKGEKEEVYDIEVEDNHSFTVQNTIVHNCQDISVAGLNKGLSKGSDTRSSLLWECEKIIDVKRPKYLLMENVKNLVGKKHKDDFLKWLKILEAYGYSNYWEILNAKDYGIPQNRERVFCVSILNENKKELYKFPEKLELNTRLKDLLEEEVDEKYYMKSEKADQLIYKITKEKKIKDKEVVDSSIKNPKVKQVMNCITARYDAGIHNKQSMGGCVIEPKLKRLGGVFDTDKSRHQAGSVYDKDGLSPTLSAMHGGWLQPGIIEEKVLIKNATKKRISRSG